jgi:hypothetical protein
MRVFHRSKLLAPLVALIVLIILVTVLPKIWSAARSPETRRDDSSTLQLPVPTTQPHRELTPMQVVETVMEALRNNDAPSPDSGIATTFAFASPANKRFTGPLPRFISMVHDPVYAPMLGWDLIKYGRPMIIGDRAQLPVQLLDAHGELSVFVFDLARQSGGEFDGCWMTDGVARLPTDESQSPATEPAPPPAHDEGPPPV